MTEINHPESDEKIMALKRYIVASPDASDLCKKACLFIIDHTQDLSKSIVFPNIPLDDDNYQKYDEVVDGLHDMGSSGRKTRLHDYMKDQGFSGFITYSPRGYLAHGYNDVKNITYIPFDLDKIETIDLDPYR